MRKASSYRAAKRAGKKQKARVASPPVEFHGMKVVEDQSVNPASATFLKIKEQEACRKVSVADVDKAMEKALTNHWARGGSAPLELSRPFAARARALGWLEGVEFKEAGR